MPSECQLSQVLVLLSTVMTSSYVTMNDNRVVWLQKHSVIGKNLSDHVANYGQQEILVEQSFVNDYEVKHLVGFSRR